ncbi:MAG: helix-turn-helix domain-containing protein [Methanobrevibacter sp.]|nr:helix-turn-helix domain-containing protein [Methanobrevibacter sp.]
MENNDIMKLEEVMQYLDIGKNTLYGLLKSGELDAFKIGKVWKIPRKSVEEYVNKSLQSSKQVQSDP